MNLESRKIIFVQEFLRLQNEEIISGLENLLHQRKAKLFEKSLKPMSMKEFNQEIDRALDDSKNNRVTEVNDLKAKIKKWH